MKPSRLLLPLAATAAVALAGCASSSSAGAGAAGSASPSAPAAASSSVAASSPSASASASATSTPSASGASASGPAQASVSVDERASGTTVHLPVGGSLLVVLHSTQWAFPQNSAPALLQQVGRPLSAPGGTCPPGQGCGTVTTRYLARQAGTVTVTDHRSSCGEARRCKPGEGDFRLTVVVGTGG
ncbi:hypothetical protein [Streptacidiphilus monticola]|uniref:Proteinase inhibitor I42 chagasin domain-containing protein n=1 Tax=Streptacidiphilus monticola TaxID=2161674 RepID=A0ABW1G097_9ACTN